MKNALVSEESDIRTHYRLPRKFADKSPTQCVRCPFVHLQTLNLQLRN